jgi:agmatinase
MTRNTYAGIPQELSVLGNSKIVLIPVPYDGTSTWQKGADKGPQAFLSASQNMELFDIETQTQVYKQGVYLADAVTQNGSPQAMVDAVHAVTKSYILKNKFVTIFGGEHSISIGTIRAFNECFDNLTVLQLDAHADLRKHYQGSSFNHACALYEASQTTNLLQVGIRSMDISEVTVMDKENIFFAHQLTEDDSWMDPYNEAYQFEDEGIMSELFHRTDTQWSNLDQKWCQDSYMPEHKAGMIHVRTKIKPEGPKREKIDNFYNLQMMGVI